MGALIDDLIPIVRKLRRIGSRVEFDVAGDEMARNENSQWANFSKKAHLIDRTNHAVDSFTLEWAPDNSFVGDCEFCVALARNNSPESNILIFDNADDEIAPSTGALNILVKFMDKVVSHMRTKVRWMKRNSAVEFVNEEHGCGNRKRMSGVLIRERLLLCKSEEM